MASNDQRYPLSTADGKAIPLDIVKPSALVFIAFENNAGVGSESVNIPDTTEILSLISTADCIVRFGAVATIPANRTIMQKALFVPAGLQMTVAPPAGTISVLGFGSDPGTLVVNFVDKWAQLATSMQVSKL